MSTVSPPASLSTTETARARPPSPNAQGGPGTRLKRRLFSALTSRAVLRTVGGVLRRHAPLLKVGSRVVVTRYADALEVLDRDIVFAIGPVNGESIERINGRFILGMDRGAEYTRDHEALRAAARREDEARVRDLARDAAARAVQAARPHGRIEAVQALTRAVPAEVVERYFGFPGPDRPTLQRWLRNLFQDAFLNSIGDPYVRSAALASAAELKAWALPEIARRRAAGTAGDDDVMGRMIALQPTHPFADDDWVRRNIAGLIVGAVDTQSRFSVLALDELLRRPRELASARDAAAAGDADAVRRYAWEAVRFNPHTPLMARRCVAPATVAAGTPRARTVPAGASVLVLALAATFDPDAFPEPGRFRVDRDVRGYLHFGWGMHQCFGLGLNMVVIPEIVGALLALPNLRRAGRLRYDGPFPDRMPLAFD